MVDIFSIRIPQEDAKLCNVTPFEDMIRDWCATYERARQYYASLGFHFDGYNDRPEPIAQIPETRAYVRRLYERIPFLLYFMFLEPEVGAVTVFITCFADERSVSVTPEGQVALEVDERWVTALCNALVAAGHFARNLGERPDGVLEVVVPQIRSDVATIIQENARPRLDRLPG